SIVGGVAARASATRSLSCSPMVVTAWAPASYRRTPPFTASRAAGTTIAPTTGSSSGAAMTSPRPIKLVEAIEPKVTSSKRAITPILPRKNHHRAARHYIPLGLQRTTADLGQHRPAAEIIRWECARYEAARAAPTG